MKRSSIFQTGNLSRTNRPKGEPDGVNQGQVEASKKPQGNAIIEAARTLLESEYARASTELTRVRAMFDAPQSACGLTPDSVKFAPAYRVAKARRDEAFASLRAFNKRHKPARPARKESTQ